tara:strand:+ start:38027 stop:38167 length:141 start_codon:yes stop_codon:yes gene_type:complete
VANFYKNADICADLMFFEDGLSGGLVGCSRSFRARSKKAVRYFGAV